MNKHSVKEQQRIQPASYTSFSFHKKILLLGGLFLTLSIVICTFTAYSYSLTTQNIQTNFPGIFVGEDSQHNQTMTVTPQQPTIQEPQIPIIAIPKISVPWKPHAPTVQPLIQPKQTKPKNSFGGSPDIPIDK